MATILEIPIDNDGTAPGIEVATKLAGKSYVLRFRWSEEGAAWYVDVALESGEDIVTGKLVTLQRNLLRGAVHVDTPPGVLLAVRATPNVERPTLEGLGTAVRLYHVF